MAVDTPGPAPKVDDEMLQVLCDAGLSIAAMAEFFGVHRATIHRHKAALGLSHGASGPQRRDVCQYGHSMEDAFELAKGGRACRKCKRRRDRESARKRYWQKKIAESRATPPGVGAAAG